MNLLTEHFTVYDSNSYDRYIKRKKEFRLSELFSVHTNVWKEAYVLPTFQMNIWFLFLTTYILQRRIQDRRAGRSSAPAWKKRTCFCKFSLYIRKYFDFSQHAVLTICILFTTLLTKTYGMYEGASKQTLDLRILPRRDFYIWCCDHFLPGIC